MHRTGATSSLLKKSIVFVVGGTLAGAAFGAGLGKVSASVPGEFRAATTVVLIVVLLCGLAYRPLTPWQIDRETPVSWLAHGPLAWSFLNGAFLAIGALNRLAFWLWYLVPLTTWMTAKSWSGALVWGTYGFTRTAVGAAAALVVGTGRLDLDTQVTKLLSSKTKLGRSFAGFTAAGLLVLGGYAIL